MHFSGWHFFFFFNNRKCMFLSSHEWTIWAIARQVSSYLLTFPKENNQFSLNNLDVQSIQAWNFTQDVWTTINCCLDLLFNAHTNMAIVQMRTYSIFFNQKKSWNFLITSEKLKATYNVIFPIDILLSIFISIFFITYYWFSD